MSLPHLDDFIDDDEGRDLDCYECAGEGVVFDCFDGLCVNAEDGCEDCMHACPVCTPRRLRR